MSQADEDDDDDDEDEDEKKDRFLEAAEQVISSMKQTEQKVIPLVSPTPSSPFQGEEVKALSDPSHKLSDHLIASNSETVSFPSDPSHSLEDHIADEIVSKENDPTIQNDMSDLILPDVIVEPVPGRVSWMKPLMKPKKRRDHVHRGIKRASDKEMPFSNGWKHTEAEHDAGSEEDKLFHQFEDMFDGGEMEGDDEPVL